MSDPSSPPLVNKRIANIPVGAPNYMFNWGEDGGDKDALTHDADKQRNYELHPQSLP